jgi:prepilin-type N-terminal cleavage/methylation domain-containing protein
MRGPLPAAVRANAEARARSVATRLADDRGMSLPELLVGVVISAIILIGTTSVVFSTNQVQRSAADRSKLSAALSVVSLAFDRDVAMASAGADAKSHTTTTPCATAMNLGFLEGGAAVRYQAVAAATDGPYWLQRVSGAGTITIARYVTTCTWLAESDTGGRRTIRLDLALIAPAGETLSQTLRGAPRLW